MVPFLSELVERDFFAVEDPFCPCFLLADCGVKEAFSDFDWDFPLSGVEFWTLSSSLISITGIEAAKSSANYLNSSREDVVISSL